MIGPISRPLAPFALKGIHVPVPATSAQRPRIQSADSAEPAQPSTPGNQADPASNSLATTIAQAEVAQEGSKSQAEDSSEKQELAKLEQRDAEVRAHEQAHKAAAGQYARGGASFQFEVGPDGRRYAVGGEVSIDIGQAPTPEQTVLKAQIVRRAALAPAEPSAQDRRVAAMATAMEASAKAEMAQEQREEANEAKSAPGAGPTPAVPEEEAPRAPKEQGIAVSRAQGTASSAFQGQAPETTGSRQHGPSGSEIISQRAAAIAGVRAYRPEPSDHRREPSTQDRSLDRAMPQARPNARAIGNSASLDIRM
ncbi:MAG: hypothetical protein MUC50_18955 [Myxococcota bacterium]|jgi:hypothetical protein|nr:hypothetical protein [Myxococcota bacterium]